MIDQINELPEDGLKSLPETSRHIENKWISRKNLNQLYVLHVIDILNDFLLICRINLKTLKNFFRDGDQLPRGYRTNSRRRITIYH